MVESRPRVYFLANACHVCKSKDTPYACEICRMIFYCSAEHRRAHWVEHSRLCWALSKVCPTGNGEHVYDGSIGKEVTEFKHEVARACVRVLGRGLQPWELEMIYHPRRRGTIFSDRIEFRGLRPPSLKQFEFKESTDMVCNVCQQADWKKLEPCRGCQFVYTCDKAHFRKDHSKWCKTFRIYSEIIVNESSDNRKRQRNDIQPEIKNGIRGSMAEVVSKAFRSKDKGSLDGDVTKALISDLLTYPLTVLNDLNAIQSSSSSSRQEVMTILFVGAEIQAEVEPPEKWEKYFLHALPLVKILNLIFLGPELRFPEDRDNVESLCEECRVPPVKGTALTGLLGCTNSPCRKSPKLILQVYIHQVYEVNSRTMKLFPAYRSKGKEIRWEFASGKLYHDYIKPESPKPDLICAMNSGMYRDFGFRNENSWEPTIRSLFTRDTARAPVLITEYTRHELNEDLKRIRSLCGKVSAILGPQKNPFASLKPGLNIISEPETPFIFKNYYHVILRP